MSFIKKHKTAITAAALAMVVLAAAYFFGGKEPSRNAGDITTKTGNSEIGNSSERPLLADDGESTDKAEEKNTSEIGESEKTPEQGEMKIDEKTGTDEYKTEPVPDGMPTPVEPEKERITDNELTCTLSVVCDTAVGKSPEKESVIPADGIIFPEQQVVFYEGESVFNVLVREMKKNKIHLEFVNTPVYNSAYIEGIGNLYEFDCGELSGWMYRVNGWFPNYGCSRYELKNGDRVEWVYTCDLGKDVGGGYSARNGAKNE